MNALKKLPLLVGLGVALGAPLGAATPAGAVENVPDCSANVAPHGGICNENCELGTNVVCQPGQQIVLNNGADLDLGIYSISCATGETCTTAAVKMNAANSVVKSTVGEGKILGTWSSGVGCASLSGSRVTGVRIDGTFSGTAVANCAKVDGNVIIGGAGSQTAVSNNGIADSDHIIDNYIDGLWENRGISLTGDNDILVSKNVLVLRPVPGTQGFGMVVNSSVTGTIADNVIMGDSERDPIVLIGTTQSDTSGNICDPTMAAIPDAIAAGECATIVAPFELP